VPCPYNKQHAVDETQFRTDVCSSIATLSGKAVDATTNLRDDGLGYDTESVRLIGNGLEGRLRQNGCVVRPIPDQVFDGCNTVGELASALWSYLM
jgi:hypothetical protein